jgi:hypothetical protein
MRLVAIVEPVKDGRPGELMPVAFMRREFEVVEADKGGG